MDQEQVNIQLPPPPRSPDEFQQRAGMVVQYVNALARQWWEYGRREWEADAERAFNLYIGRHFNVPPQDGMRQAVINRIENIVIAQASNATGTKWQTSIEAFEKGEPGRFYLNVNQDATPPVRMVLQDIPAETYLQWQDENGVTKYPRELTKEEVATIQQRIQEIEAAMPGAVPPDILIEVNDALRAEALNALDESCMKQCQGEYFYVENIHNCKVFGWQDTVYGFDDVTKKHTHINPLYCQTLVDPRPGITRIREAAGAMVDMWYTIEEAVRMYPAHKDKLREHAHTGQVRTGNYDVPIPKQFDQTDFRMPMVVLRKAWLRYQPYPMSVDEAVASGAVVEVITPQFITVNTTVPDEVTGELVLAQVQQPSDPIVSYQLENGEPTEPTAANWPTREGIREVAILANELLYDRETEFGDIPIARNINKPIPNHIYGQGEAARIDPLNMIVNAIVTDILNYTRFYGLPPVIYPQSVAEKIPGFVADGYTSPAGTQWVVPNDVFKELQGQLSVIADVPEMPRMVVEVLQMVLGMIDNMGTLGEEAQGRAPSGRSNAAIESLLDAARESTSFKTRWTEWYLEDLANLRIHTYKTRFTAEDCYARVSKWPIQVWYSILDGIHDVELDIRVELASGRGAGRQQKRQAAAELFAGGQGPISEETLLDLYDFDAKSEREKKLRETKQKAIDQQKLQRELSAAVAASSQNSPAAASPPAGPVTATQTQPVG